MAKQTPVILVPVRWRLLSLEVIERAGGLAFRGLQLLTELRGALRPSPSDAQLLALLSGLLDAGLVCAVPDPLAPGVVLPKAGSVLSFEQAQETLWTLSALGLSALAQSR